MSFFLLLVLSLALKTLCKRKEKSPGELSPSPQPSGTPRRTPRRGPCGSSTASSDSGSSAFRASTSVVMAEPEETSTGAVARAADGDVKGVVGLVEDADVCGGVRAQPVSPDLVGPVEGVLGGVEEVGRGARERIRRKREILREGKRGLSRSPSSSAAATKRQSCPPSKGSASAAGLPRFSGRRSAACTSRLPRCPRPKPAPSHPGDAVTPPVM